MEYSRYIGQARIGSGCCVEVGKNATMTLGKKFNVTGRSTLLCTNLSWDLLIMDTDWHKVISINSGEILNSSKTIKCRKPCMDRFWMYCS